MSHFIKPQPDAYFYILILDDIKKEYFLDIFDDRTYIFQRVHHYLYYYRSNEWQKSTDTPFPETMFICPDQRSKQTIRKYILKNQKFDSPTFYLTTKEQLDEKSMNREILEKVTIENEEIK